MQMVHQLAIRIRDIHALGYVHRDLKPGNVMWLPRENRWTVIDFGCAARTGEPATLGFSVAYAAPEVISAYRAGEHSMVAEVRRAVHPRSCGVPGCPSISCLRRDKWLHTWPCNRSYTSS